MPAEEGKKPEETQEAVECRSLRKPQESQEAEKSPEAERFWICHIFLSFLASTKRFLERVRDLPLDESQAAIVPS